MVQNHKVLVVLGLVLEYIGEAVTPVRKQTIPGKVGADGNVSDIEEVSFGRNINISEAETESPFRKQTVMGQVGAYGDIHFSDVLQESFVRKQMSNASSIDNAAAEAEYSIRKHKTSGKVGTDGDMKESSFVRKQKHVFGNTDIADAETEGPVRKQTVMGQVGTYGDIRFSGVEQESFVHKLVNNANSKSRWANRFARGFPSSFRCAADDSSRRRSSSYSCSTVGQFGLCANREKQATCQTTCRAAIGCQAPTPTPAPPMAAPTPAPTTDPTPAPSATPNPPTSDSLIQMYPGDQVVRKSMPLSAFVLGHDATDGRTMQRAESLKRILGETFAGRVDESLLQSDPALAAMLSGHSIEVMLMDNGRYIVANGNGRISAMKLAFADHAAVKVDVDEVLATANHKQEYLTKTFKKRYGL